MDEITITMAQATRFIQDNGFNSPSGRLNEFASMVALAMQGQGRGHKGDHKIRVYGIETVAAIQAWQLAEDRKDAAWLMTLMEN